MLVDCAHYQEGSRRDTAPLTPEEAAGRREQDGFVWLGLHDPTDDELREIADCFALPPLAVEDAMQAHQRPKIEDYEDGFFLVLHTARYIDAIEEVVFSEGGDQTRRVYFLRHELADFHRAVRPLLGALDVMESRTRADMPKLLRNHLRDVQDHVRRVDEEIALQRDALASIFQANLAVIGLQQNEVVRKISGWAAIIAVPTFMASIWGMNFEHMPELGSRLGYPIALLAMALVGLGLFTALRRAHWL